MKHKRICRISTTFIPIIMLLRILLLNQPASKSIHGYFYHHKSAKSLTFHAGKSIHGYFSQLDLLVKVSMDTFTIPRVLNFCHFTLVKVSMDTFTRAEVLDFCHFTMVKVSMVTFTSASGSNFL